MATTITLSGRLADLTSRPIDPATTTVTVKAPAYAPGPGVELTTTQPAPVPVGADGEVTLEVVQGVGWLIIDGPGWSDSIRFVAAVGMTRLLEAVINALPASTDMAGLLRLVEEAKIPITEALNEALTRVDAEVAVAVDAEMGGVTALSEEALSRAKNAEGVAAAADAKSTSATSTASTAVSTASNAVARVAALEEREGLSPESPVDGQTANLIRQPDTLTRAALMDAGHETFIAKRAAAHSTFLDTPDGDLPTHTDSGHEWAYMSARGLEVRDGHLRPVEGDFGTMPHAEISMGAPVTRMGAIFRFSSEGGTRSAGGGISLNAWGDGGIAANGGGRRTRAHVDLNRTSCGLGVREAEGAGGSINIVGGRHTFPEPLELDTWYTLEWWISGDTAIIAMPDGHVHVVSDPRIESIPAEFADFQLGQVKAAGDVIIEYREVWADATADTPDDSGKVIFRTARAATRGTPPTVPLPNNSFLKALDAGGNPRDILGASLADTVILKNGGATDPASEIRLRKDGLIDVAINNVVRISVNNEGALRLPKLLFTTSGHGITLGAGSPEGVVDEHVGSIYIQYNGGRAGGLWQREIAGAGNTGWRPVGHPSGYTSQRPASPAVGLSYFDRTLGKPIWWNGTAWVDAMGVDVDEPPAGE